MAAELTVLADADEREFWRRIMLGQVRLDGRRDHGGLRGPSAAGEAPQPLDDEGVLLAQTSSGLRRFQSGDVSLRLAEDELPGRRLRSG